MTHDTHNSAGDQFLAGITLACTVSTEIPFFFFAGRLIKSVGVHILILTAMVHHHHTTHTHHRTRTRTIAHARTHHHTRITAHAHVGATQDVHSLAGGACVPV
jgi:hypothetical protein